MSITDTTGINVSDLMFGVLFSVPVPFDWSEDQPDDPDDARWSYTEAIRHTTDDGIERILIARDGQVTHLWDTATDKAYAAHEDDTYTEDHWVYANEDDDGALGVGALDAYDFRMLFEVDARDTGPRMNYFNPVDYIDADNAARVAATIISLPLVVVEVDGKWGLALTGGGMDLSWEIVEAYVLIGLMPPVHYARDLPAMHRRGKSAGDRLLIDACLRSLNEAAAQLTRSAALLTEAAAGWARNQDGE